MHGYGHGPIYVGAPQPQPGRLPSEAEFLVHTNKLAVEGARSSPIGSGKGNLWYLLFGAHVGDGTSSEPHTDTTEIVRDRTQVRNAFRNMTEGRADGAPLFAFVALYTIDGHTIVDSQWWADARYVVTLNYAPASAADQRARALLGVR